jgi:RimJ/RimL family protein N-acetyltransferase
MGAAAPAPGPTGPVTLEGRFVRLEPLTHGHLDALAEIAFEPSLWRWTSPRVTDRASLAAYVDEALAAGQSGTTIPFATVSLAGSRVVGSTRFLNILPRDSRVEIGATWVAVPFQRSPVNTEAKYLMLRHAFETLAAVRVELKTHAQNEKSRAAIERLGAQFEGIHRKHMLQPDGTRRDTAWYSIVDDEWPDVKARLEARLERRR